MYRNRRYDEASVGKYLPKCIIGGLATILLTTNIIGFIGMKNMLDSISADKYISQYGTSKYARETMEMNKPKNKILEIVRFACVGLGEEIACMIHKD